MPERAWGPKEVVSVQGKTLGQRAHERLSGRRRGRIGFGHDLLALRWAGQALGVLRAFLAQSQLRAAAEWEGGGRTRAPPSPPAVTGAITLLAADGYQLARASLSRSPPLLHGTAGSILASPPGKCGGGQLPLGTPESSSTLRASPPPRQVAWESTPLTATRPTRATALGAAVAV